MRRRITLTAAATALIAVLLLAVPLAVFTARGYVTDERLELQRAAATAAASLRGDAAKLASSRIDRSEVIAGLYDQGGVLIDGAGPKHGGATVRSALSGTEATATTPNSVSVAAPVSDGDRVVAVIVLHTDLAAAHHRGLVACLIIAAMGSVAVLLAAACARIVARRLSAPIERLNAGARAMGAGDLGARVAPSGVAELDVLAATLNAAAARIHTMIGRERSLSTEVSHQLRTPLTGLRLELERIHTSYPADPRVKDALRSVDRLADTVTDIITLARDLPEGQQCSVSALLRGVEQRWHALLADSTRPLLVAADDEVATEVAMSSAAATQILDILLDNAHTHGSGAVTVRARALGGAVAFDVSDEGEGPAQEPHALFADRDGTKAGGIGLPLARKLAEAEYARVAVTSLAPPTFSLVVAPTQHEPHELRGDVGLDHL